MKSAQLLTEITFNSIHSLCLLFLNFWKDLLAKSALGPGVQKPCVAVLLSFVFPQYWVG